MCRLAVKEKVNSRTKLAHDKNVDAEKLKAIDELGARIIAGADALGASMVPTATTLAQMISEPAKYLAKLDMVSGVIKSSEGPVSKSTQDVYEVVAKGMDSQLADFDALVKSALARFDDLTREIQ